MKTQPRKFTLSGDGLCVGFDSGDAVSQEYTTLRARSSRRQVLDLYFLAPTGRGQFVSDMGRFRVVL